MTEVELPVFCINLDHRQDRWAQLQQSMGSVWPEVQIAAAQSGFALGDIVRWPGIIGREDGCRKSHLAIVAEAQRRGWQWVLIMEDDCEAYPEFVAEFAGTLSDLWELRDRWDVYFSGPGVNGFIGRMVGNILQIKNCTLTHMVIVNMAGNAGSRLLQHMDDKDKPIAIDHYYGTYMRCVTRAPMLTYQRPSVSDIQEGWDVGSTSLFTKYRAMINSFKVCVRSMSS